MKPFGPKFWLTEEEFAKINAINRMSLKFFAEGKVRLAQIDIRARSVR